MPEEKFDVKGNPLQLNFSFDLPRVKIKEEKVFGSVRLNLIFFNLARMNEKLFVTKSTLMLYKNFLDGLGRFSCAFHEQLWAQDQPRYLTLIIQAPKFADNR